MKTIHIKSLTFLIVGLLITSSTYAQLPWETHGKLTLSKNRRYLVHADGTPFFWLGDTPWNILSRLDREGVRYYLDNRKAKGMTVLQMVLQFGKSAGGTGTGPKEHNPRNVYGFRLFHGDKNRPDVTRPHVITGGSPDQPNDFWDHVDYVLREARKRGLYVGLLPTWGSRYIDRGKQQAAILYSDQQAKTYGRFLGKRYSAEPHIIWILGGDTDPQRHGDKLAVYRAMAEGIAKGATGIDVAWNQPHPVWRDLVMTFHPRGELTSSTYFHTDPWLMFNMLQNGQPSMERVVPMTQHDYGLSDPVKPIVNGESCYELWTPWSKPPLFKTGLDVRRTVYQTFFCGGAGYTYGCEGALRNGGDELWGFVEGAWKHHLNIKGVSDLIHVRELFDQYNFFDLAPDQSLIVNGLGCDATVKCVLRSGNSDRILIYFPDRSKAEIRLDALKAGQTLKGIWFDPRNGQFCPCQVYPKHNPQVFMPPAGWEDAVLILIGRTT